MALRAQLHSRGKQQPKQRVVPVLESDVQKLANTHNHIYDHAHTLANTPSANDGVPRELETTLRVVGCELIQNTGIVLGLNQVVMACAQILFQRFYYRKSFKTFHMEHLALACLFLAAKVEESAQPMRRVVLAGVHVFHKMSSYHVEHGNPSVPIDNMSLEFAEIKNDIIKAERRVLKELGFCVHVKHPHKLIISIQKILSLEKETELSQLAWNYMNDGLRTNVFLRFSDAAISCACLHLAAIQQGLPLPDEWWACFGCTTEHIEQIAASILQLYKRPKVLIDHAIAQIDAISGMKSSLTRRQERLAQVVAEVLSAEQGTTAASTTETQPFSSQTAGGEGKDQQDRRRGSRWDDAPKAPAAAQKKDRSRSRSPIPRK